MSRLSQGLAGDNSATALTDITITYTTDDPGITPDGALTIADGDGISAANTVEAIEELVSAVNAINAVLRASGAAR